MSSAPDDAVDALAARLRASGSVFAEEEAAVLLGERADPDRLERMVRAREAGLPLEHVVGWAELCGVRVAVREGVFVPRRRTELLVRTAVALLADRPGGIAVDLCCGSGAIGAAVAALRPDAEVHACDVDPAAVACARLNLPRVHGGDLFDALPADLAGRVDVVVANAPYVPTDAIALMPPEAREHEHRVALDGGSDGLDVQRRVAREVGRWLAPGGHLVVETSVSQAPTSLRLLRDAGLTATVVRDDEVDGTAVVGRRDAAGA